MEWTAEDYESVCDNITGERLRSVAVQIARREGLEFMHKLAVLKEVPVDQCWSESNGKPTGTKCIDIGKGDAHRVEIRKACVAIELKLHQSTHDEHLT